MAPKPVLVNQLTMRMTLLDCGRCRGRLLLGRGFDKAEPLLFKPSTSQYPTRAQFETAVKRPVTPLVPVPCAPIHISLSNDCLSSLHVSCGIITEFFVPIHIHR